MEFDCFVFCVLIERLLSFCKSTRDYKTDIQADRMIKYISELKCLKRSSRGLCRNNLLAIG
jgi:hypothetical protein